MARRTRFLKLVLGILIFLTLFVVLIINTSPSKMKPKYAIPEPIERETTYQSIKKKHLKLFHLDLKGAPPKMEYILKILPLARDAGADGILIEYEDMFPWNGILRNISAKNAYTRTEITHFLELAKSLKMEVIPLVQTFGHLEFILKLEEFRHLRELDSFPQEICPSKSEAVHIVKEMIRQIMDTHKGIRYLHIGCDEVYHIAACSVCSKYNSRTIFKRHVTTIADHVSSTYEGVRVIIWDDMLRRWPPIDIESSDLGKYVELMVWVYIDDIPRLVPHYIWFVYKKTFPNIWAASAFKGAFGEKETLPDLSRHMENQLAWLRLMRPNPKESNIMNEPDFQGIALTGWSRYDHFAVLAELLPLSVPSLILNLAFVDLYDNVKNNEAMAFEKMVKILKCPDQLVLVRSIEEIKKQKFQWFFGSCNYPGSTLYPLIAEYLTLQARLTYILNQKQSNGWITEYNIKHNFSSPWRVLSLFNEEGFAAQNLKKAVRQFKGDISENLQMYFDNYTVNEWIEQKLIPIEATLNEMELIFQKLIEVKSWPRRPLDWREINKNRGT